MLLQNLATELKERLLSIPNSLEERLPQLGIIHLEDLEKSEHLARLLATPDSVLEHPLAVSLVKEVLGSLVGVDKLVVLLTDDTLLEVIQDEVVLLFKLCLLPEEKAVGVSVVDEANVR